MNPRKQDGERMRNGHLGVAFPPDRKAEVEAVAKANGLTVSAWVRMIVFHKLDEIKRQQQKQDTAV